ncbi:hypothetical protein FQV28_06435 [Planomicrobium sp. CPCC 101079]|nr:hypothetical protein FQV28_06435 [Planomicrobium sp. CPCC 101079]
MKGRHLGGGGRKDAHSNTRGAKTFRRGRALAFLEKLELRQATLKKQLETPELQAINPILIGELKATETIMDEFVHLFELHESGDAENSEQEASSKTQNELENN